VTRTLFQHLSRRERQILDILYQQGQASAAEVQAALPDAPSYSAVRALLHILEEKGHIRHRKEGVRYIYLPTHPHQSAARLALRQLVQTFFEGNAEKAVSTLISDADVKLSKAELTRLAQLIEAARQEGHE
jgi:BlaI family penicillinase repressor